MRRARRPIARLAALALVALALAACERAYRLEDRETPVHVWLEAPAAAQGEVTTHVLLHVGDLKVLDGPVRFPAGQPRVELAPVYMPAGSRAVSVVVDGRTAGRDTAKLKHATWILVSMRGNGVAISVHDREPGSPK
jgi:hypothetical protein